MKVRFKVKCFFSLKKIEKSDKMWLDKLNTKSSSCRKMYQSVLLKEQNKNKTETFLWKKKRSVNDFKTDEKD